MKHKVENLEYNAPFECWCRGILNCTIDGIPYAFEPFWESSGRIVSDHEGGYYAEKGEWILNEEYIPKNITKEMAEDVIEAMNLYIEPGCCGGCI